MFKNSPHQIVGLVVACEAQEPSKIAAGEFASCWTSLDLVHVFMQLLSTSDFARRLCTTLWSNARDVTVMMYALVQLNGPWDETYVDFTASVLIQETMVVRKFHKDSFLKEIMERFLAKNANVAMTTIMKAYQLGWEQMHNYNFFKILYLSCCEIPQFVSMFSTVPASLVVRNLQMLVHFAFLHSRKQEEKVRMAIFQYWETAGWYLIDLLLHLLNDYLDGFYSVIDNFLDAEYTRVFLLQCKNQLNISPERASRIEAVHSKMFSAGRENFNYVASRIDAILFETGNAVSLFQELQQRVMARGMLRYVIAKVVVLLLRTVLPIDPLWTNLLKLINMLVCYNMLVAENVSEIVYKLIALAPEVPDPDFLQQILGEWFSLLPGLRITKELFAQVQSQKLTLLSQILWQLVAEHQQGAGYATGEGMDMGDPMQAQMQAQMQMQAQRQMQAQMARSMGAQDRLLSPTNDQLTELQNRQREIQKEIVPVTRTIDYADPEDRLKERISMLINNLTEMNLSQKVNDLSDLLSNDTEKWFVDFLVRSRVERQDNYHGLYLSLVNYLVKTKGRSLFNQVIDTSIQVTQELLTSDIKVLNEQHLFLKNMGGWLGLLTIGQDICLSQLHLNLTDVLLSSFYHKRLWYVYEFVCFLLRGCKESQVIKPPQPWLVALLSLLKEIYMVPGIKEHFARLFKNFLEYMKYREDSIQFVRSDLYLAIPDVTDNQDFNPNASQSEVYNYFLKNYPQLKDLQAKSHGLRDFMNKEIREFVPRRFQPHSVPMNSGNGGYGNNSGSGNNPNNNNNNNNSSSSGTNNNSNTSNGNPNGGSNYEMQQGMSAGEMNISSLVQSFIREINRFRVFDNLAIMVFESVYSMFLRDLVQVQDNQKLEGYLKNAALSLIDSLLLIRVSDWEARLLDLLNGMYRRQGWSLEEYFKWVQIYAEAVYQNIKIGMHDLVYQHIKTRILDVPREYFTASKNERSPAASGLGGGNIVSNTQQALSKKFHDLVSEADMTENEKISNGELTALQESLYSPNAGGSTLTFQDVMLSQEALHDCFINMYYQYIARELNFFFDLVQNAEQMVNAKIEDALASINRLKENAKLETHIPAQDKRIVELFVENVAQPKVYMNFLVFDLVMRIARILVENKFPNLPQYFTAQFLDIAVQIKQTPQCVPAVVTLAANQLLDLGKLDEALRSFLTHGFANYSIKLFVFLVLIDLVLMRELVTMDQLPLTMETLEKVAASEEGKKEFDVEGSRMSAVSLVESLRKKKSLLALRVHVNQTLESDVCKMLQQKIDSFVQWMNSESDVLYCPERMDELVELVDSVVQSIGDDGASITFYLLLWKSMQIYLTNFNDPYRTANYICDLVIVLFGILVHREAPQNRVLVFKAQLAVVQALLFEMHDLTIRNFYPFFFLRVLAGLFKEVVVAEAEPSVRAELAQQFCALLLAVSPTACPAFLFSWLQLLTRPQVLRVLIAEKNPALVSLAGDLVVSLFSLTRTPFAQFLTNYTSNGLALLSLLRESFPGFLAARCSLLLRYLPPEARRCVLDDVPPEFNFKLANQDRETFLARVLPLRAEPVMAYIDELDRVGLVEAAEAAMREKAAMNAILRAVMEHGVAILRFVVMFWIMEEERVQKAAGKGAPAQSAAECIAQLLHSAQHEMQLMGFVMACLLDYVRFPCKETKLYLRTLMALVGQMSPEMKRWVMQQLIKKPLFTYFELKQFGY